MSPKQSKKKAETTKSKALKENIENEKPTKKAVQKPRQVKKDEESNVISLLIEIDRFGHCSD